MICKQCVENNYPTGLDREQFNRVLAEGQLKDFLSYDLLYDHIEHVHHLICVREKDGTFANAEQRFIEEHVRVCSKCREDITWKNRTGPKIHNGPEQPGRDSG